MNTRVEKETWNENCIHENVVLLSTQHSQAITRLKLNVESPCTETSMNKHPVLRILYVRKIQIHIINICVTKMKEKSTEWKSASVWELTNDPCKRFWQNFRDPSRLSKSFGFTSYLFIFFFLSSSSLLLFPAGERKAAQSGTKRTSKSSTKIARNSTGCNVKPFGVENENAKTKKNKLKAKIWRMSTSE